MTPRDFALSALRGILVGLVIFVALAIAQLVINGLAVGVLITWQGQVDRLLSQAASAWWVGLVLAMIASLIALSRDVWWASRLTRGIVAGTVLVLAGAGWLLFYPDYLLSVGTHSPVLELLVSGSQATAVYAFVGVAVATLLLDRRRSVQSGAANDSTSSTGT